MVDDLSLQFISQDLFDDVPKPLYCRILADGERIFGGMPKIAGFKKFAQNGRSDGKPPYPMLVLDKFDSRQFRAGLAHITGLAPFRHY